MSLHIGDRILEVNGTPVKDQPIENIENIIRYSDTVLQVHFTVYIYNLIHPHKTKIYSYIIITF